MKKKYPSKKFSNSFYDNLLAKRVFVLVFLWFSLLGYSQGDTCSAAVTLTSSTSCSTTTGSTVGATDNNETGDCTNGTEEAVWYKFVASATAHTVTIDGATGFDAVVGANSACGSATRPTGGTCTDNTGDGGIETLSLTGLTIGNTYYIQVYDYWGVNMANAFTICITHSAPMTNDDCSSAIALTVGSSCTYAGYTTVGATASTGAPAPGCASYSDNDVWFSIVAPASGILNIDTNTGSITDSGMAIYSGSCGSLTLIECDDDDANGAMSALNMTGLTPGATYYIRFWDFYDGEGTFSICASSPTPPANDNCSGAISLTVGSTCTYTTYTNANATASSGVPASGCASYSGGDIWFSVVVPASGILNIDTNTGSITDSGMAIYSGACGSLTLIECDDDDSANGAMSALNMTGLTPGATYYIRVWEYGNDNNGTFSICASSPTPPANDNCSGAISLTVGSTCAYTTYTNANATASSGVPAPSCASYSGGDVWFSVVVPASGNIAIDTQTGVITDSGMAIYSGACGALTEIECDDDDSNNGAMSYIFRTGLTPGATIYIRVWEYGNDNNGTFGICVTDPAITYCSPTSDDPDGLYINSFAFIGTLLDPTANTSTFNATGYQDFTALTPLAEQAQGEGVNIVAYATGTAHLRGTWKAWVDWNKDGDFTDAGEEVYNIYGFAGSSVTFGFAIPATQTPGNYKLRIRVNNGTDWFGDETFGFDFTPCDNFTTPGGFSDDNYGETEDYLFKVIAKCNSLITTITDGERCGTGTVSLGATATSGVTEFRWYSALTGGALIGTSTPTGTSTTWTTPSLSSTTTYYVTAWDGSCESQVRTAVIAKISPTPTVSFTPSSPVVCGESAVQITAGGDKEKVFLINEKFDSGLGVFTAINSDTNPTATDNKTIFQNRTSVYVPSTNVNVWFPAISSGFGPNKFALTLSDPSDPDYPSVPVQNSLALTNVVNTTDYLNLTLKLKFYYSRYYPSGYQPTQEYATIELSTNGGTTYLVTLATFTSNQGIGTRFLDLSYDLSAYINQPNLKIRVRHYADASASGWLPGGVAVDNVELFGEKPLNTAFNYDTAVVQAYTNAGCTTSYTPGTPATTIWIKPTLAQLENAFFTIPVDAVLSNGCSATGSINVTNNTKVFKAGTAGTDWNTATNWSPNGVPTASNCVIIVDDDVNVTGSAYNGLGLNLTVKPTGNLNIASSNSVTITDFVQVDAGGIFQIEDDSNLVQVNNVSNTGNIIYNRTANNIRGFDYVYWSSPVVNQSLTGIYSTPTQGAKYIWNPTVTNSNLTQGNWQTASGTMTTAKGYIIRGSSASTMPATNINAVFTGVPVNGNQSIGIARGGYIGADYDAEPSNPNNALTTKWDDNWNLVGNPYPSAIYANKFLATNSNIQGFVKIWSHGTAPVSTVDPFYQNYTYNYTSSDYITYNGTGSVPAGYNGYIPAGQGFMICMNDGSADNSSTVTFDNTMRRDQTTFAPYNNSQFYKNTATQLEENQEKHRIWLDIIDSANAVSRTLVGYVENATNDYDRLYDAVTQAPSQLWLYSFANSYENQEFNIQGRALPFDTSDIVPLGYNAKQAGQHTIAIASVDGLFENQAIYLEDKLLNVIHNLSISPYSFTTTAGMIDDRFQLRYTNSALSTSTFNNDNSVQVVSNTNLTVYSSVELLKSIEVFDVLGRKLADYENINSNNLNLFKTKKQDAPLLLKIKLNNGNIIIKKVIY
jgi:hypothetical protein